MRIILSIIHRVEPRASSLRARTTPDVQHVAAWYSGDASIPGVYRGGGYTRVVYSSIYTRVGIPGWCTPLIPQGVVYPGVCYTSHTSGCVYPRVINNNDRIGSCTGLGAPYGRSA